MIGRTSLFARNALTQFVRQAHGGGGLAGENLPFQIKNKYRFSITFIAFFSVGFALPFLVVRHQLLKN